MHATAGFVDPGFKGTLTLEITNLTRVPIKLYDGLPIAQLSFMTLDAPAERPYGSPELGSHYQGQTAATESRYGPRGAVASRPMLATLATITACAQEVAEEEESEPVAFYILGGAAARVGDHALPDRHALPRRSPAAPAAQRVVIADQRARRRGRDGERRALQLARAVGGAAPLP